MLKKYFFLIMISLLTFLSCTKDNSAPTFRTDLNCNDHENLCDVTNSNNAFGIDIFKKLHQTAPEKNIFISPLSISTALMMTTNGAKGQTYDQITGVLHYDDLSTGQINSTYKLLLTQLPQLDDQTELNIANSIWYRNTIPVEEDFLHTNIDNFNSEIKPSDFNDSETVNLINGWVEDKTQGLIKTVIDEISPQAIMYLINAIYFKGTWLNRFDADLTTTALFHLEDNSTKEVEMMQMEDGSMPVPYFKNDIFQAVDLAYGDSIFSMSILLPNQNHTVDDIIEELTPEHWETWMDAYTTQDVLLRIPKFKMKYKKELKQTLQDLGMQLPFNTNADFSGIAPVDPLFISFVLHKSFIEVDEAGTEAAAVTVIGIETTSVPNLPVFIADKPFVFAIRDNQTKSILFIGKMMVPE